MSTVLGAFLVILFRTISLTKKARRQFDNTMSPRSRNCDFRLNIVSSKIYKDAKNEQDEQDEQLGNGHGQRQLCSFGEMSSK